MKKVAVLVSSFILFTCMTFAQTPQTQDKGKSTPAKSETTMNKNGKNCSKTCTHNQKSGSCTNKGADDKGTKAPEKK
jgi:hypothetical protein